MSYQAVYFATCIVLALGGYVACFFFAKRDWPGYAFVAFLIGSSAVGAAGKIVYDNPEAARTATSPSR